MPESLFERRLKLGRFWGIDLYVHWTFLLVILYVAFVSSSTGAFGMAFAIAQLLGVFLCVTLHEYGHAIAARQFGIPTADITLLPIGGVARLKRMPRIPWQETVVAIAGPAVNVVIGGAIIIGFLVLTDRTVLEATMRYFVASTVGWGLDQSTVEVVTELFTSPSLAGYAVTMLIVNIVLVAFNMIPAFPMDGGRVFRSVLAMGLDYRRATRIASRVGLICAAIFGLTAISASPPQVIPFLIAIFIGYAGMAEARQVELMESVRGLTVGDVMIETTNTIPMDLPLGQIIIRLQSYPAIAMPVVSVVNSIVGMLDLAEIRSAVAKRTDLNTPAGELVNHDRSLTLLKVDETMESALMRVGRGRRQVPVVDDRDQFCGLLDLETVILRSEIASSMIVPRQDHHPHSEGATVQEIENPGRFDQLT